jgi:hypothetical protein
VRYEGRSYKSYLTFLIPPVKRARQQLANARRNAMSVVRQQMHLDFGMKELIDQFYRAVSGNGPLPIPYREIVLTARIMDSIFERVRHGTARQASADALSGA